MKILIVFAAVVGLCASFSVLTKLSDQVLLRALQGFQYPHHGGDPCIGQVFVGCQHAFNDNLNISSNADWQDPIEFIRQLGIRLQQGVTTGLIPVCNAWQILYSCLSTTYYNCFNPIFMISEGFSLQSSFLFTAEILRTQFKCVGGFEQSIKQYSCIFNTFNNTQTQQDQCISAFNQTLTNNVDQICEATQNLTACFMNLFASCGNEAQWWVCEDVRVGFSLFSCPNLRCDVPAAGGLFFDDQRMEEQEITEEVLEEALVGASYKYLAAKKLV